MGSGFGNDVSAPRPTHRIALEKGVEGREAMMISAAGGGRLVVYTVRVALRQPGIGLRRQEKPHGVVTIEP